MSLASGNVPVSYMVVDGGFRGTDQTVELMSKLAMGVYGARSPKIRALAINILTQARVPEKDYTAEMVAIHNWVRDNIRYTRDVHGQETLSPPEEIAFNSRAGDCDDKSMLLAALLGAVGIATRFKVIGVTPQRYSHVYLQARPKGLWISLDPIMRDKPAGWEAPKNLRAVEKVYPENVPEGIAMQRGVQGLGYVGDPRIVSHLEPDPAPQRPAGPYVKMNSFLDNDAPIEQLSNDPPAFPQNAGVRNMRPQLAQRRPRLGRIADTVAADQNAEDAAVAASMMPGIGMGDVYTPEQLAAISTPVMNARPKANMQRPAMAVTPEGIDVAFGRNALVMRGDRGDRILYRGMWALNEKPPIQRLPVQGGMNGFAPGTVDRRMLPGMGYLDGHSLSGPGISDLSEGEPVPAPVAPATGGGMKTLGLLAVAAGLFLLIRKK